MNDKRMAQIKNLLFEEKRLISSDLCSRLDVSIETVRRYLNALEAEGLIRKVYGGAVLVSDTRLPASMQEWNERVDRNAAQKQAIAAEAVLRIPDHATIALDSGTTCLETARLLYQREGLTVLTNSLYNAIELGQKAQHTVYCIGGAMKNRELITTGGLATHTLDFFAQIDVAVLSTDGFSLKDGMSDYNVEMGALKRMYVERANRVFLLADHTKFLGSALFSTCKTSRIDLLITDAGIPPALVDSIRAKGVEVVIADAAPSAGA